MINIKLKTPQEFLEDKEHLHNDIKCVYLLLAEYHAITNFELLQGNLEFVWVEYDQNDEHTGTTTSFTEEDDGWLLGDRLDNEETYDVLECRIDGIVLKEANLYINTLENFEKELDLI